MSQKASKTFSVVQNVKVTPEQLCGKGVATCQREATDAWADLEISRYKKAHKQGRSAS